MSPLLAYSTWQAKRAGFLSSSILMMMSVYDCTMSNFERQARHWMHTTPLRKKCGRLFQAVGENAPTDQAKQQDRKECEEVWNEHLVDLVTFGDFSSAVISTDDTQRIPLMETSSHSGAQTLMLQIRSRLQTQHNHCISAHVRPSPLTDQPSPPYWLLSRYHGRWERLTHSVAAA